MKNGGGRRDDHSTRHLLTRPLDAVQSPITMSKTTVSIRDLRNHFPKVRKAVEAEGEILLTEKGKSRYRLSLYTPPPVKQPAAFDYWGRLVSYQPEPMTEAQARALRHENRGEPR